MKALCFVEFDERAQGYQGIFTQTNDIDILHKHTLLNNVQVQFLRLTSFTVAADPCSQKYTGIYYTFS